MKPQHTELALVSESLGLCCTIDYIGPVKSKQGSKVMILDWKTGKNIYDSYDIQLSIYMAIYWDYTGILIEDLATVQIPQDGGKAKVKIVEDPWQKLYAGLLTFERWKHDNYQSLMWVRAPQYILEQRKKTRGKKRKEFNEYHWEPWFEWPWYKVDSLLWWKKTYEKLKGAKDG